MHLAEWMFLVVFFWVVYFGLGYCIERFLGSVPNHNTDDEW
jgi:hypothetical protein